MNPKYQDYLLTEIKKISQKAIRGKAPTTGKVMVWDFQDPIRGNWSFSLLEKDFELYQILVNKTLDRMPGSEKFTEQTLANWVFDLLESSVYGENIDYLRKQLEHRLKLIESFSQETTIQIPIEGLKLEYDNIRIGEVFFKKIQDKTLLKIMEIYGEEDWLCAEYRTIAEPQRALERAINETRLSIDIIRFALASLPDSDIKPLIGLRGEVPKNTSRYPYTVNKNVNNEFSFLEIKRGISKIKIDLCHILRQTHSYAIIEILNSASPNNFEKAILSSIQWFSNSEQQSTNTNKILALITCLETFLSGEYGNPIRNTVAEGCALVIRKKLEERKYIKNKISDFYEKRSSISHGSNSKEVRDCEVAELKTIVQVFIQEMIKHRDRFESTKQFMEWINDIRLS